VLALFAYWREAPPVNEALAQLFPGTERGSTTPGRRAPATAAREPDVPADNNPAFAHALAAAGVRFPPGVLDGAPRAVSAAAEG
jgi:hypothetical protein